MNQTAIILHELIKSEVCAIDTNEIEKMGSRVDAKG